MSNKIIEITKGEDRPIGIQLLEEICGNNTIFKLDTAIEIKAIFQQEGGGKLELLLTNNEVEIVSANDGDILIKFETSHTELLQKGRCQSFEIEVINSLDAGVTTDTFIWRFRECLVVHERIC